MEGFSRIGKLQILVSLTNLGIWEVGWKVGLVPQQRP